MNEDIKKHETNKLEDWKSTSNEEKHEKREKKKNKSINTNWIITFLILTIGAITNYVLRPSQNLEDETKILDIILPSIAIPFFIIVFISYFVYTFLVGFLQEKITFSSITLWTTIILSVYFLIKHFYLS